MALSDDDRYKNKQSTKARPVTAKGRHWSDSQKIEAVTTYLALGELRLTANVLKIPEITLKVWKRKEWWLEIERELRQQENLQLSTRLRRIIDKSFTQLEDRLENGDFVFDQKTGQMIRKPVNMRDAHRVAVDLIDKKAILENQAPQVVSVDAIDEKLNKLAERFAQIAQSAKAPIEVTDVIEMVTTTKDEDDDDALHEEWEEGLQEGEPALQLEAGTDQESVGTHDSTATS